MKKLLPILLLCMTFFPTLSAEDESVFDHVEIEVKFYTTIKWTRFGPMPVVKPYIVPKTKIKRPKKKRDASVIAPNKKQVEND